MSIQSQIVEFGEQLPAGVTLVAVSKTHPVEALQVAYGAGQRIFGENRPQEMAAKFGAMPGDMRWHMIGHLQTNKVRLIAPFVELIHSVDSERLLSVIDAEAARVGRIQDVLMEVHIGKEPSKGGWLFEDLRRFMSGVGDTYNNVCIRGLMGIATFTPDVEQVRSEMLGLRTLFEELGGAPAGRVPTPFVPTGSVVSGGLHEIGVSGGFDTLSMGMSADWRIALECGATMIRLGSTIFGERSYR